MSNDLIVAEQLLANTCIICANSLVRDTAPLCSECSNYGPYEQVLVYYLEGHRRLDDILSIAWLSMQKRIETIIEGTDMRTTMQNIDLWKRLSAWYADAPDDIEVQDIENRSRLQEIMETIPEPYRSRLLSDRSHVDVYTRIRSTTDKTCPSCGVVMNRDLPEDTPVGCGLCNNTMIWGTLESITGVYDVITIDDVSHLTSQSDDISRIIQEAYTILPNLSDKRYLGTIYALLAIDNELERFIVKNTRGYTTNECAVLAAIDKSYYDNEVSRSMVNACLLRDLNINANRLRLWTRMISDISGDGNAIIHIWKMERFYSNCKKMMSK